MASLLTLGDCLEVLDTLKNNSVKLTITSPPYDDLRTYEDSLRWDFGVFKKVADKLFRVTEEGGVVVWVVGDATVKGTETGSSFRQALYFKDIGFNIHDTMIYHKDNPPPIGGYNRYYSSFEYMFVFSKGKPSTFNPIIKPRRNKHNDKRTERMKKMTRDKDGSFTIKKNSEVLKTQLSKNYSNVYIARFKTPHQTYYRVRIKAESKQKANKIALKLQKAGYNVFVLEWQ